MTARRVPPRPFPIQPLLDAAGITVGSLARKVRAGGTSVAKAARQGLSLSEADRWALRLDLMPETVWPDLYYTDIEGAA